MPQAACGHVLAYQILVFLIDVDQLLKYGTTPFQAYSVQFLSF